MKQYIIKKLIEKTGDQFLEERDVLTLSQVIDLIQICMEEKDFS